MGPTMNPTVDGQTRSPSESPTMNPTVTGQTRSPTMNPTVDGQTRSPSESPTMNPTVAGQTRSPTQNPVTPCQHECYLGCENECSGGLPICINQCRAFCDANCESTVGPTSKP